MPPAPEAGGDGRHVDGRRAQPDKHRPVRSLLQREAHLDPFDARGEAGEAPRIRLRPRGLQHRPADLDPGHPSPGPEAQRPQGPAPHQGAVARALTEEAERQGGEGSARFQQAGADAQGARGGALGLEGEGVRHQPGQEAGRGRDGEGHGHPLRQQRHQLGRRRCLGVHQVDRPEAGIGQVMVDVQQGQGAEQRRRRRRDGTEALQSGGVKRHDGLVRPAGGDSEDSGQRRRDGGQEAVGAGQGGQRGAEAVGADQSHALAQPLQDAGQPQGRADGIRVRFLVGAEQEALVAAQEVHRPVPVRAGRGPIRRRQAVQRDAVARRPPGGAVARHRRRARDHSWAVRFRVSAGVPPLVRSGFSDGSPSGSPSSGGAGGVMPPPG